MGGGILNGWEAREMEGNYAKMLNILQSRKSYREEAKKKGGGAGNVRNGK